MAEVIWNDCSCCGTMQTGVITYPDGEQIRITKFLGSEKASAIAYIGGVLNSASGRIPGGQMVLVASQDIADVLNVEL